MSNMAGFCFKDADWVDTHILVKFPWSPAKRTFLVKKFRQRYGWPHQLKSQTIQRAEYVLNPIEQVLNTHCSVKHSFSL